jgi:hypothetical protein
MSKPLIQINDLVREMTDEEYAVYQAQVANAIQAVNLNLETTQE